MHEEIRLSKLMTERGICSRREADIWIENGLVYVDNIKVTQLGTKVTRNVKITLDTQALVQQKKLITVVLNKPVGYVSNLPERSYKQALELITKDNYYGSMNEIPRDFWHQLNTSNKTLSVVGRLDIESQGLLLLSHDGRLVKSIIGDTSEMDKEYIVRVQGHLSEHDLALLRHGLELDGSPLKVAHVDWINDDQLKFVLTEGKKRQIRRMCELVGLTVLGLKRVRIGPLKLGSLPEGKWRLLTEQEKKNVLDFQNQTKNVSRSNYKQLL